MRIKMAGTYTPEEFVAAIQRIVDTLVANGADCIRGSNIYINPAKGQYHLEFQDQETGAPFELIEFTGVKRTVFSIIDTDVKPGFEKNTTARRSHAL